MKSLEIHKSETFHYNLNLKLNQVMGFQQSRTYNKELFLGKKNNRAYCFNIVFHYLIKII